MADRERTAELVLRSRRSDRAAFTELVRRYENAAYATALTYTHHVEDAQDIVQDAFVIAYCKLAQLREPEHFGTWLGTIVRRQALEWLRREQADRFAHEASETVVGDLADLAWVCGRTSTSSGVVRPIFRTSREASACSTLLSGKRAGCTAGFSRATTNSVGRRRARK
jgi:RNA polymerase sigma factor (sigma-70 family)